MKRSTFFLSLILALTISPASAKADKCVKIETSFPVRVHLSCGFNIIGELFHSGDWYEKGERVCKNNKMGFIPMPCVFEVNDGTRACSSGVRYGGSVTIRDDVMPSYNPDPDKPQSCNW